jgi:hypothetical protein
VSVKECGEEARLLHARKFTTQLAHRGFVDVHRRTNGRVGDVEHAFQARGLVGARRDVALGLDRGQQVALGGGVDALRFLQVNAGVVKLNAEIVDLLCGVGLSVGHLDCLSS